MSSADSLHVVGIGSSAGGLETLQELFKNIPAHTGFAFVIVQHLSPTHNSLMHELLARHISMPITVVEEKTSIAPNHIYLISKDWDLELRGGQLLPREKKEHASAKSPIDRFFISLAESLENKALAIVLSGTGSDGSVGIRAVKEKGGIVIVQNPDTAKFDGMPQAAFGTGMADFVLDTTDIGSRLNLLSQQVKQGYQLDTKKEGENELLEKILLHVKASTGLDYSYYRRPTLLRRIDKRCKILNMGSIQEYYELLLQNENETQTLAQEFLIGVSSFFRDEGVWKSLEKNVIPELFKSKLPGEQLRLWVGGCSTGEEAYTLALLLHEFKRINNSPVDFKIFASDLDKKAITFASNGIYGPDILQQIPSFLLDRYFEREEKGYRVTKNLREKIVFAQHNLIADPPFIKMDLISCRNVLIYFTTATQRKLITKFHFALNNHGYLVLGSSENLGELANLFKPVEKGTNIFCNIQEQKLPGFIRDHNTANTLKDRKKMGTTPGLSPDPNHSASDFYAATLMREHAPISIFINQQYDVLYIHGDADNYLRLPQRSGKLNLLKMLGLSEQVLIRKGVQQAMQEKSLLFKAVDFHKGEQSYLVDLAFKEVWNEPLKERNILIEIYSKGRTGNSDKAAATVINTDQLSLLEQELKEKDHQLSHLKEQLETSNEQLMASNEELHASNQELQSSNEELQSVNEELHTLNSELKQRIEEVTASNTDIDNLFTSTSIATLFLDQDLKIRKYTPQLKELISITENDVGRSIADFSTRFRNYSLEEDAAEVLKQQRTLEREVVTKEGRYFLSRISPYRQLDGGIKGVVVLYIDLTEKHKAALQLKETADRLSLVLETSQTGYAELLLASNHVFYDEQFSRIFGVDPGEKLPLEQLYANVHPEDIGKLQQQIEYSIKTGESTMVEYRVIWPHNKEVRHILAFARTIKNDKGEVVKLIGAVQDQSQRKRQEEEALWYWRLLEESHNEIFMFDASSLHFLMANMGARQNLGYSMEELKQLTPVNISPDYSWNDLDELLSPLRTGERKMLQYNTLHQRKDGTQYPVLINLQLSIFLNREIFTAIVQDITELVKTQRELQEINERLDFAIRGTSDGMWDWSDIHSNKLYWSPRFFELLGMKAAEVAPTMENFFAQIHPDDVERTRLGIQAHMHHEAPYDIELRMLHKTKGYRWFRARGQAFRNKEGKIYRMAGSLTDIHQRKQDDLDLREMNRKLELANTYLDNFVYTAAHDLRAPVSNLRTLLSMMNGDEKLADNLSFLRIKQSANRLEDTLQGLVRILEIQRNESPELTQINIEELFELVKTELEEEDEGVPANYITAFEAQSIFYVEPFLHSIIRNLLSNALKYRSAERPLLVEVSTRQAGEHVLLEVKDNGIGLDLKRYGKKLFKPFERLTKQAMGQGLGLHLVKTMVERNGGYIVVEGDADQGLHFKLYLKPYTKEERHIPAMA